MNWRVVKSRYTELRADAGALFPRVLNVPLVVATDADTEPRAYAYCTIDRPVRVGVAPKLATAMRNRIDGVLRHEIGHAIDALYSAPESKLGGVSLPGTPELRADAIAGAVWGSPIRYDADAVQTIGVGGPRPAWLPQ